MARHNTHVLPILLVLPLAACAEPTPPPRAAATAPSETSPARPHDAVVAALVGVWAGKATRTPIGPFTMALAFDRNPDGQVHSRLEGANGMYLDFRFHRQGGAWLLTEEGYLPGVGTQKHTLVPAAGGPGARWVDREDAELLVLDVKADRRALWLAARVRGEDHARFELARMEGEAADQVRAEIASLAGQHAPAGGAVSSPR